MAEAAGIPVEDLGLFTDLYQLTMVQSYLEHDKNRPATFSLIVRKYPPAQVCHAGWPSGPTRA
jgi:nicotinic acid phosphoribosyltransferase